MYIRFEKQIDMEIERGENGKYLVYAVFWNGIDWDRVIIYELKHKEFVELVEFVTKNKELDEG